MQSRRRTNDRTQNKRCGRIPRGQIIALDVETSGLNPYSSKADSKGNSIPGGARIFCWAYYTEKGEYGFMEKTPENLEWVKRLANDPSKTLVFHNAKFDLKMFWFEGMDVFNWKAHVDDTFLMHKVMNSTALNHDLKTVASKLLNADTTDKNEIEDWIKANKRSFVKEHGRPPNFTDAPIEIVKRRCLWDVKQTLLLHRYLKPRMTKVCPDLYETERKLMYVCIDMENAGVRIDVTRARELKAQAEKDLKKIMSDLNGLVCPFIITKTKKRKRKGETFIEEYQETIDEINPGSSQIHLPAAFKELGIPLIHKTKPKKSKKGTGKSGGGNWSFDEYAMIQYVSKPLSAIIRESGEDGWTAEHFYKEIYKAVKKHKLPKKELFPPLILKYRELSKMINTYYVHLIEDVVDREFINGREYGIMHCKFNQSEAMTGRFSCSEPNLQNMPRILGPRECFVPRHKTRNWHIDYSQVEMRLFVHFAKDSKMATAIDADIHTLVASQVYNLPMDEVSSEQRKRSKAVNFGIIYGSGPAGIGETLTKRGLPTKKLESMKIVADYHKSFPSVRRTTNELKVQLVRNGFITNPFGRRYHIRSKFAYKALNYMCQGTSADIIKKAMVEIWLWLRANNLKSRIIKTIHDEIVLEIHRNEERRVVKKAWSIMEDLESYFVPITVDAEINDTRWSDKKKVKKLGWTWMSS